MRYFLDTEFIEDGKTIDLISIGLVSEDGRTYYAQNAECQFQRANDWVWRNVYPHLTHFEMSGKRGCLRTEKDGPIGTKATWCGAEGCPWRFRSEIRDDVIAFCDVQKFGKPEIWGYYADYDWVAFCQLFGTMMELPKGFPMYCQDIKQWADQLGDVRIPKPEVEIHHALHDALQIEKAYKFLANQK